MQLHINDLNTGEDFEVDMTTYLDNLNKEFQKIKPVVIGGKKVFYADYEEYLKFLSLATGLNKLVDEYVRILNQPEEKSDVH